MDRLLAQLQRLYFLPDQAWRARQSDGGLGGAGALTPAALAHSLAGEAGLALDLASPDGRARAMAVGFARAGDWEQAARLCQAVQEDLDLPAPAVSVSGQAGYQVWFSLARPAPLNEVRDFLAGLRRKYLAELPAARLELLPERGEGEPAWLDLPPALHPDTGKWSAFIDPSMGAMFVDEPGLEMAPNLEKQADLLARFDSIKPADFERALGLLQPPSEPAAGRAEEAASGAAAKPRQGVEMLDLGGAFGDPKSFLLAVMNDPGASAKQRIKAAKALLPYFERKGG